MNKIFRRPVTREAYCVFTLFAISCLLMTNNSAWALDAARYITIDEIQPGMEAYCLTTYKDTAIEKFNLEVINVVRNIEPGRDAILVKGTDERFIHTGPVAGCSGSPVYIDGRLAGALSFGWAFSKDPLYGVTPIEEMLRVGENEPSKNPPGLTLDMSGPIDFAKVEKLITTGNFTPKNSLGVAEALPCPVVTSGVPSEVCEQLNSLFSPFGLFAVSSVGGRDETEAEQNIELTPGASLTVPLVTGDIQMAVIGTVTETIGDDVYGFGDGVIGYGSVDLPMATGKVHTIVSNLATSFKLATAIKIIGALTADESTAVLGKIGKEAKMIPLTIKVNRYNDTSQRIYNCRVANNRLLTPVLLQAAVAGAAYSKGGLPIDHTIQYEVNIKTDTDKTISFANVSANTEIAELMTEIIGATSLLLNNPYKEIGIESIDFDINMIDENIGSHIWSVDLSDSKVKAGEKLDIEVVVESVRSTKKKYTFTLNVPKDIKPGKYELLICGGYGYLNFLKKAEQYKFMARNAGSLIEAMNNALKIRRDGLHLILTLPAGGITLERAELPDLPATKALVLIDEKRTLTPQPYQHWLEENLKTGTVVIDSQSLNITVEQ